MIHFTDTINHSSLHDYRNAYNKAIGNYKVEPFDVPHRLRRGFTIEVKRDTYIHHTVKARLLEKEIRTDKSV
tara:strand:+ start:232 stop:447 length:216 start_codon:yes stop_codon:yes gene_type:complete